MTARLCSLLDCEERCCLTGAVELRNALTARYNLDLPLTVIFDYPTVAALAALIAGKLAAAEQPAAGSGGYDAALAATVDVGAIRCVVSATLRMHACPVI